MLHNHTLLLLIRSIFSLVSIQPADGGGEQTVAHAVRRGRPLRARAHAQDPAQPARDGQHQAGGGVQLLGRVAAVGNG